MLRDRQLGLMASIGVVIGTFLRLKFREAALNKEAASFCNCCNPHIKLSNYNEEKLALHYNKKSYSKLDLLDGNKDVTKKSSKKGLKIYSTQDSDFKKNNPEEYTTKTIVDSKAKLPMASLKNKIGQQKQLEQWTNREKKTEAYQTLLAKWGTKEGVFEVGYGKAYSKKEMNRQQQDRLDRIKKQADILSLSQQIPSLDNEKETYEITQVTLNNTSDREQEVNLWGGNLPLDDNIIPREVKKSHSVNVGLSPREIGFNPFNNSFYVVNQLSETIEIFNSNGKKINEYNLRFESCFIGAISPVTIVIIDDKNSNYYGYAYIVGSVSNKIYELSPDFKITRVFKTENRPVDIAYCTIKQSLIVPNLRSQSLTNIKLPSGDIELWNNAMSFRKILINPTNGNVFLLSKNQNKIYVYNRNREEIRVNEIGVSRGQFEYHTSNNKVLFLTNDKLIILNGEDGKIDKEINLTESSSSMRYDSITLQLYIANRDSPTYTIIDRDFSISKTLPRFNNSDVFCFGQKENSLFEINSHNSEGRITVKSKESIVKVNRRYTAIRQDFQHSPAVVKHLRVINSGNQKLNSIRLISRSISGKENVKTYSFRKYDNPRHFADISEINDLQNAFIDGRNRWQITLPPRARITLLVYHLQYDTYSLLPETARKSTGVEMSKGILNNAFI